jgi:hypothetical protein
MNMCITNGRNGLRRSAKAGKRAVKSWRQTESMDAGRAKRVDAQITPEGRMSARPLVAGRIPLASGRCVPGAVRRALSIAEMV